MEEDCMGSQVPERTVVLEEEEEEEEEEKEKKFLIFIINKQCIKSELLLTEFKT
jgi:hypothetical protein